MTSSYDFSLMIAAFSSENGILRLESDVENKNEHTEYLLHDLLAELPTIIFVLNIFI